MRRARRQGRGRPAGRGVGPLDLCCFLKDLRGHCGAGGICGACVARVAKGEVDQSDVDDLSFTLDEDQIEAGMALLCMARAKGDVTLETQCDWGLSLGIKDWEGASGKLVGEVSPLMGKKWSELTAEEKAAMSDAEREAAQAAV